MKGRLVRFGRSVGDLEISPPRSGGGAANPARAEVSTFAGCSEGPASRTSGGRSKPGRDGGSRKAAPFASTTPASAWRSTWISPCPRVVRRVVGKREGSEIVLREQDAGGRGELWVFSKVASTSFRRRAEGRAPPGGTRRAPEEYYLLRRT